jgi:hypothetical protein
VTLAAEVRHALPAIGEHHRQITDHPPRVMTTTPLLDARQAQRERPRKPQLPRDLREQRGARVRDQTRSVRRDIYGYRASITHHPQSEPPELGKKVFDNPNSPSPVGRIRAPDHPGRGQLTKDPG